MACARSEPDRPKAEPVAPVARSVTPVAVPATPAVPASAAAPTELAAAAPQAALGAADCNRICAAATRLGCKKSATCVPSCLAMIESVPKCGAPLASFFKCLGSQAAEHWECLEDGTGAIRDGFCDAEQSAFAECVDRNPN